MCWTSHRSKEQALAPCQRNNPLFLDSPGSRVTASLHLSGTRHVFADTDEQSLEFIVNKLQLKLQSMAKIPRLHWGRTSPQSPTTIFILFVISWAICASPDRRGGCQDWDLSVGDMVKASSCRAVWLPCDTREDPRESWWLQQVSAGGKGPPSRAADWVKVWGTSSPARG